MGDGGVLKELLQEAAGETLPGWPTLQGAMERRALRAGETVFQQEVAHPFVYGIAKGLVKLCYVDAEGQEWIKSFSAEGQYFASVAALAAGGRTSFTAIALEACQLERVDYRRLLALAAADAVWSRALYGLALQFAVRKERREFELLTLNAEQRYLHFCAQHPALAARVPQKDLARHLGLTPVGLNRIVMRVRRAAETA